MVNQGVHARSLSRWIMDRQQEARIAAGAAAWTRRAFWDCREAGQSPNQARHVFVFVIV
jgi:hypothetical protein